MHNIISSKSRCFFILLFASFNCGAQNVDINLLRDINLHRNRSLDGAMKAITNYDYPVSIAIPFCELIVGYAGNNKDAIMNCWQTVAGFAINGVITYGTRYAVNRPRPYVTYPDLQ